MQPNAKRQRTKARRCALLSFGIRPSSVRKGFTLLEMVVSFGIFSVVIVTAVGALIAISNAQVKAVNIQSIQDNIRFALESMTKEMRTGKSFVPSGGNAPAYTLLTFIRSDGTPVTYCGGSSALRKISGSGGDCATAGSPITSDAVIVEQVVFYVIGQAVGMFDGQPRITIALKARSSDPKLATSFRLQTTVVQRERDL
ncbi:MAG: type II secretion system protein [bacterium]|nr:type II secretion system protein [bacterium]